MEIINSNLGYVDVASIIGISSTDFARLPRQEQVNWLRKVHSGEFFNPHQHDVTHDIDVDEEQHITNYIIVDDLI